MGNDATFCKLFVKPDLDRDRAGLNNRLHNTAYKNMPNFRQHLQLGEIFSLVLLQLQLQLHLLLLLLLLWFLVSEV